MIGHNAPGRRIIVLPTTTTVVHSAGNLRYSYSQTFTATVADTGGGPVPEGTVQFFDDGVPFGAPQTLVVGVASISTSSLAVGSNTISAEYTPSDGIHLSSSGQTIVTILYETQSACVLLGGSPVQYGASQTLRATLTSTGGGTPPDATVSFYVDGGFVGSAMSSGGIADLNIGNTRNVGTYTIRADYPGSGNYASATGSNGSYTINQATVSFTFFGSTPDPNEYGQAWNLSATLSCSTGVNIVGTVTFHDVDNATDYSTESGIPPTNTQYYSLVSGTFTGATTLPTSTTWKAKFDGSANFAATGWTSNHTHTTNKQDTHTYVDSVSVNPAPFGDSTPVTFTGHVAFDFVAQAGTVDVYLVGTGGTYLIVDDGTVNGDGTWSFGVNLQSYPIDEYEIQAFFLGTGQSKDASTGNWTGLSPFDIT